MTAAKYKFVIEQGATFDPVLTWKRGEPLAPVDLTGFTAVMQVFPELGSSVPLLTLTTENGGISLGGTSGTIMPLITDESTALIPWTCGVYFLELVQPDGKVRRKLYGPIIVNRKYPCLT